MGRTPCCSKDGMNKGAWTAEEDQILRHYITTHGEGKWRNLPKQAGLKRCGKSCRLRWLNYLRPDIKRGNITEEEEDLIIRLHKLLGNRWALIAGRIPGRTDNEVKNYWNTTLRKKVKAPNPNQKSKEIISSTINEQALLIQPQLTSSVNIQTSESSGQQGFELQDHLAMNPLLDSFDVDEFLHSEVSDSVHDLWKLCTADQDHRREFEFDETLMVANDFQNAESNDHSLPSSSCKPIFFSEEMLMEHWTDHVRDV